MQLTTCDYFQVIVVGSGLAGLSAAIEASEQGCSVAIFSSKTLFSGSSFYPGTWGFGLVGPENEADNEELVDTVCSVGCAIPDRELVKSFVSGINPAIDRLCQLGFTPHKAEMASQREYIPCFDHKHRNWNGIDKVTLKNTFTHCIQERKITVFENSKLLEIVKENSRVIGAVFGNQHEIRFFGCRALVLATGGYGQLFRHHLCTDDVNGYGQYAALKAGCSLINMEFMQMMIGFLDPGYGTVFNEKTYRFAEFISETGAPLLSETQKKALELRSSHGPFTSTLSSMCIDTAIHQTYMQTGSGPRVSYTDAAARELPEFVKVYFDWLQKEKHISIEDPVEIALFAHASNGGVRIDDRGFTGIPGLYACGEVTGGMHGADRLGGLSTANGLVFGQRAGRAAGAFASASEQPELLRYEFDCEYRFPEGEKLLKELQERMYRNVMISRAEAGLKETEAWLAKTLAAREPASGLSPAQILTACTRMGQLMTARSIVMAARLRKESRGSHQRADFPQEDPRQSAPICISLKGTELSACYRNP